MADVPLVPDGEPSSGDRYLVTARKYRPQTFADLVAQEHVAETLSNAITGNRLAHAYLFSGPRGVGKTTAARILAKAVNCQTPLAERDGAEPCRTCSSCRDFEEGRSLNVIEVDAASNNGVDYVRELRETVRVPPQGAAKKIYVLDEAHMFSTGAWNALLKTLEEPPPYVLFIFATTEPHKVLPTILSRTQRFDFRRIAVPEIVARLREIGAAEGVEADEEALVLIARKGDGALRDALSLYDQARALCGNTLTGEALREALGVVPTDLFFDVTDRAAAGDRAGLLTLVETLVGRGYSLPEFVDGVADHVRNLYVARATGAAALIEGTDATRERYLNSADGWAESDLLHLLMLADGAAEGLRESRQPRLTVELALLKMASLERAADLERLLAKLDAMERALASGARPATPPAASPPVVAPPVASPGAPTAALPAAVPPRPELPRPAPDSPSRFTAEAPEPYAAAPAATPAPAPPVAAAPPAAPRPPVTSPPPHPDDDEGDPPPPPPAPPRPAPALTPPSPSAAGTPPALFPRPALQRPPGGATGGDGQRGPAAALALGAPADAAEPADPHFGPSLGRVREAWPALVEAVREREGIRLSSILKSGRPVRVARGAVEVGLADEFACRVARGAAASVAELLTGLLGDGAPPLVFAVLAADAAAAETGRAADPFEKLKTLRQEHPTVRALFERFGAEIVYD